MNLAALEVHEQALSGDQHRLRRIHLAEPAQVECRPGMAALSRLLRQDQAPKIQGRGQVDRQPAHTAVVQPPELGLEAFAERDHSASRMLIQEAPHRGIERGHPDRMPPGTPGGVREVVLEPADDLYGERILEQRDTRARRGGAAAEIPQQRLRHPGQVDGYRLHPGDGSGAADHCRAAHCRAATSAARWHSLTAFTACRQYVGQTISSTAWLPAARAAASARAATSASWPSTPSERSSSFAWSPRTAKVSSVMSREPRSGL